MPDTDQPTPPPTARMSAAIHDVSPETIKTVVHGGSAWLVIAGAAAIYGPSSITADVLVQLDDLVELGRAISRSAEVERDAIAAERLAQSAARAQAEAVPA